MAVTMNLKGTSNPTFKVGNASVIPSYDASTNESAINVTAEDNRIAKLQTFAFNSGSNTLRFNYAKGSASAPLYPTTLSSLGSISWRGWDENTSTWLGGATITAQPDTDWNATTRDTAIKFFTTKGTTASEKIRISSSGNLLIGTTTDNGYRLNVNGGVYIAGESSVSSSFSLTSNEAADAGSTKLKFGYEGISGPDNIATSVMVEFNQTTGPDTLTEGGLIVKNTAETEVTSNYSQLTSKKLSIGGKAEDSSGSGMTMPVSLDVDLSDTPTVDDGGVGAKIVSGGPKFDIKYDDGGMGIVIHKSYRFKGTTHDTVIKDGVWTSGSLTTEGPVSYGGDVGTAKLVVSTTGNDSDYGGDVVDGGSAVFDNVVKYSSDDLTKAYRFKGLGHDVLIKDGISTTGSVEALNGVILKSPNGTKFKITVSNEGALITTAL